MMRQPCSVAMVLELLRAAMSGTTPERVSDGAGEQTWRDVVAVASAHFVLPAIASALNGLAQTGDCPAACAAFVDDIASANAARNRKLHAALLDACRAAKAVGVAPVALKGAAFLARDPDGGAAWRFMQDIDLLVEPAQLGAAVEAMMVLGYRQTSTDYRPDAHAHFPPLLSPCGTFSVELHIRLFALSDYGLEAGAVSAEAISADGTGEPGLLIPSLRHRTMHVLVHAQLHNRFYPARRIVLKDLADLSVLVDGEAADIDAAVAALPAGLARSAAAGLVAAWRQWRGDRNGGHDPEAEDWAGGAMARLGWPGWRRRLALPADMVVMEAWRMAHEPGHMARRGRLITSPAALAGAASAWRFKQRQRLWG